MREQERFPQLVVDLDKLRENAQQLVARCRAAGIAVAGVVKGASALPEVARVVAGSGVTHLCSSRMDQLRALRAAGIEAPLMLIRVPMLSELPDVVSLCAASLQSDRTVLRALNAEAERQGRRHDVILMTDLGDLREGFWGTEELTEAALEVERELKSLHLLGVGVNLSCYGSVRPDVRNMRTLAEQAEAVERAIGRPLEIVSGGASTSMYLVLDGKMPARVSHLRVGELILLGQTDYAAPAFLHRDVFTLRMEVMECRDKPSYPIGELATDAFHRTRTYIDRGIRRRALAAVGRVDYGDCEDLTPRMAGVEVLGASSDHTILDVEAVKDAVGVGDVLEFDVGYAALVYLTHSSGVQIVYKGKRG